MSMTAVSTKATPPRAPNPPPASTRPSNAIQRGADLLLNLVEDERAKMTRLYHDEQKSQESRFEELKTKHEAALTAAETKISLQQSLIEDLALQAQKWKSQSAQAGSSEELQELRSENERLKSSLAGVGLEYLDGSLRFDEPTARVVADFVQGARVQDTQLAVLFESEAQVRLIQEESLSEPVGPTEFFDVLAGVLEKGRRFATELEKRTKAREILIEDANAVTTQCMFPTLLNSFLHF
jgi:hypothetical protein